MSVFCIPRNLIDKLKQSALKGELDIKKLYEMSSKERREFFAQHTDEQLGAFINGHFERAMVSKQKDAITNWVKSVFTPEAQKKPVFATITDKIKSLDDLGVLSPENEKAFLEDLVADKLGISITAEETKAIAEKARAIDAAQNVLGNDLGNPDKTQENVAYFKAKKEMDDLLQSLNPAHKLRIATGTIGRGMMLASVKSPILNIGSNIEIGVTEALARRAGQIKGTDSALALKYIKMVNKIYQASGYDISRMTNLRDHGASGERVLGDTVHSQGKGIIRKTGQVVEDIVFKQLMGAPDVFFSSMHFADSVNLNAIKMAGGNDKKAKMIMLDAMRIEPQTAEGEILRTQAILDAQVATWTNTSWASRVSEGIRRILNQVSGDVRVGDFVLPFVKTPANVISTGMDYAGLGAPKALIKAFQAFKSGELGSRENIQSITRDLTRAGLGLAGALMLSAMLDDDDFVGAYDPGRAQIEKLRNSNTNSVRFGGKWISTDWLGPLCVPVTAIMYARKYGDTTGEKFFQYGKGTLSAVKQIPGIEDIYDFVRTQAYKKNQNLEEMTGETADYLSSQLYSRMVPSILSDTARMMDVYERKTGKGIRGIQAKIPILRKQLPIRTDIFGGVIKTEPGLSTLLFGARVKTDKDDDLSSEISRVMNSTGKVISFTDWDKSPSKRLAAFKQKVGDELFDEAKSEYGSELRSKLEQTINGRQYENMSDADKAVALNKIDTTAMQKTLRRHGYAY